MADVLPALLPLLSCSKIFFTLPTLLKKIHLLHWKKARMTVSWHVHHWGGRHKASEDQVMQVSCEWKDHVTCILIDTCTCNTWQVWCLNLLWPIIWGHQLHMYVYVKYTVQSELEVGAPMIQKIKGFFEERAVWEIFWTVIGQIMSHAPCYTGKITSKWCPYCLWKLMSCSPCHSTW